jgi:hypothetical protein
MDLIKGPVLNPLISTVHLRLLNPAPNPFYRIAPRKQRFDLFLIFSKNFLNTTGLVWVLSVILSPWLISTLSRGLARHMIGGFDYE